MTHCLCRRNAVTFWSWDICTGERDAAMAVNLPCHASRKNASRSSVQKALSSRESARAVCCGPYADTCAICRNKLYEPSIEAQASTHCHATTAFRCSPRSALQPCAARCLRRSRPGRRCRKFDSLGVLRPRVSPRLHLALAEDALCVSAVSARACAAPLLLDLAPCREIVPVGSHVSGCAHALFACSSVATASGSLPRSKRSRLMEIWIDDVHLSREINVVCAKPVTDGSPPKDGSDDGNVSDVASTSVRGMGRHRTVA